MSDASAGRDVLRCPKVSHTTRNIWSVRPSSTEGGCEGCLILDVQCEIRQSWWCGPSSVQLSKTAGVYRRFVRTEIPGRKEILDWNKLIQDLRS